MFRNVIVETPFSSVSADVVFGGRISSEKYNNDVTFGTTLRILLDKRVPDGDFVTARFHSSSYGRRNIGDNTAEALLNAINSYDISEGGLILINNLCHSNDEDNHAIMSFVSEKFTSVFDGWAVVDKVTEFFKPVFNVVCFINPEIKSVALYAERLDVRKLHYLQCCIPGIVPWYFSGENAIKRESDELALLDSLRQKNSTAYEELVEKFAEKYDFETLRIRQLLAGFELRYERAQRNELRAQSERLVSDINGYQNRINQLLREKAENDMRLFGIETKLAEEKDDSEIMDYFLTNKNVGLEMVNDTVMRFITKGYFTYFDEEIAKRAIDNSRSYVYPHGETGRHGISAGDMKMLMTAIFLDEKLKLRTCAAYELRLDGGVNALRDYDFSSAYKTYLPNPHIQRYRCLGNYSQAITDCLKSRNYLGAIEQCIASCRSINFGDSVVMEAFMNSMYNDSTRKFIELPDGSVVNTTGAIEYLKKQQEV